MSTQDVINSIDMSLSHRYKRVSDSTPSEITILEKNSNKYYKITVTDVTDNKKK